MNIRSKENSPPAPGETELYYGFDCSAGFRFEVRVTRPRRSGKGNPLVELRLIIGGRSAVLDAAEAPAARSAALAEMFCGHARAYSACPFFLQDFFEYHVAPPPAPRYGPAGRRCWGRRP